MRIIYDTNTYKFAEVILELFECNDLSKIHLEKNFEELIKLSNSETHKFQQSEYHQIYYKNFHKIKPIYENLIRDIIKPIYNGEKIVYQTIPTFRLHFPGGFAVGMFHKDKDLRDKTWHELIEEDNYFLPFTDAYDTNTIWYETEENKEDFIPMNCKYGEVKKWDGTNLTHGNKNNTTPDTRISIDFRATSESKFKSNDSKSKNDKTTFDIGGYYSII